MLVCSIKNLKKINVFLKRNLSLSKSLQGNGFNLDISDEQKQLQEAARKFVSEEVIPKASYYDRSMEFPWDVIRKAHENGFMNVDIPTKYGGLDLDLLSNVLISEAIGYGCTGIGTAILGNDLAATPLIIGANEDIKKKYLGRLIDEPVMASYCVNDCETDAGSDVTGLELSAVKIGNDWMINGSNMCVINGVVASWFFVLARTDPDPKVSNDNAYTAFVVDVDAKGLYRWKKEINLGQRCSDYGVINFVDVVVPSSQVIGIPGEGFKIAMKTFEKTRPIVAALAVGLASRALDESAKCSLDKKDFGMSSDNHQDVSFMFANMSMYIELSRLMTYKSAIEIDIGRPGAYLASIAKRLAADAAYFTSQNSTHISDRNSFTKEYSTDKVLRDSKIFQISDDNTIEGRTNKMFNYKIYDPESLLSKAKQYMHDGDQIQSAEKNWASYVCALKLVFQKVGINLVSHNAINVLSYFLNYCLGREYLNKSIAAANSSHVYFYNGGPDNVWEYISDVEEFINEYQFIDTELVKNKLNKFVDKKGQFTSKFDRSGRIEVVKFNKHYGGIFGKRFLFEKSVK